MGQRLRQLYVLVGFNVCWLACVAPAAHGLPYVGPICVLMFAATVLSMSANFMGDALLLPIAGVFGYVVDSLLVVAGVFAFPQQAAWGWPTMWWMVALWLNLAVALPVIFRWMIARPIVAAVFGLVGGPLAYWSGGKLGAVQFGGDLPVSLYPALAIVGAVWGVTMVLGAQLLAQLDGLTTRVIDPQAHSSTNAESDPSTATNNHPTSSEVTA